MKKDTKVYSSFIKNEISSGRLYVGKDNFTYGAEVKDKRKYSLFNDSQGWQVMMPNGEQSDEIYLTKKSAIYFTIKNNVLFHK